MKSFEQLLTVEPLYSAIDLVEADWRAVATFVGGHFQIDCYCPNCKEVRTFTTHQVGVKSGEYRDEVLALMNVRRLAMKSGIETLWETTENIDFTITLYCARYPAHVAKFLFRLGGKKLVKIGQLPSLVEIASAEVQRYSKVLGKVGMTELQRAVGLAAHGVGIGSVVYLRRIFETLIEEHRVAAEAEGRKFGDWNKMRVADRIKALSSSLPAFLVENAVIHGLLSAGVHTRSEEECLSAFPVLKQAIMLILQQDNERKERDQLERSLKADLNKLALKSQ